MDRRQHLLSAPPLQAPTVPRLCSHLHCAHLYPLHCRHQLSLFAHISKVTWRLDQDDRIAGTVSDSSTGDIRTIDLDPGRMTEFERVNKMWELL